jgi:hypothetical protein
MPTEEHTKGADMPNRKAQASSGPAKARLNNQRLLSDAPPFGLAFHPEEPTPQVESTLAG